MHKPTTGRLLRRVAYALRKETDGRNITDDPIRVRDAFPYDPSSRTSPKSALAWARGYRYGHEPEYVPDIVERDNDPFTVTVTDLVSRGNGGRAYKVVDGSMRRFDLREDQLMEILRDVGILPGGAVPGTFVWGLAESQVRLVMVGGALHKAMIAGAEEKEAFDARAAAGELYEGSRLVTGHVYRKRDGELHAYLGLGTFPGIEKPVHAFVPMPEAPVAPDPNVSDPHWLTDEQRVSWRAARARDVELVNSWPTLSWGQRCQYQWRDRYRDYEGRTREVFQPDPIVLMTSPKFESDVGELEGTFLASMRINERGHHGYVRSVPNGDDMVSRWKLQQLGATPPKGRAGRYFYQAPKYDYEHAKKEFATLVIWRQEKEA